MGNCVLAGLKLMFKVVRGSHYRKKKVIFQMLEYKIKEWNQIESVHIEIFKSM